MAFCAVRVLFPLQPCSIIERIAYFYTSPAITFSTKHAVRRAYYRFTVVICVTVLASGDYGYNWLPFFGLKVEPQSILLISLYRRWQLDYCMIPKKFCPTTLRFLIDTIQLRTLGVGWGERSHGFLFNRKKKNTYIAYFRLRI